MIRYSKFSVDATKKIRADLEAAGDGAQLCILYVSTDDGQGIKPLIDIRGGNAVATADNGECDPTNDSHVCPPIC